MYRIVLGTGVVVAAAGAALTLIRFDGPGVAGIAAVAAVVLLLAAVPSLRRGWSGFGPAFAVLGLAVAAVAGWAEIDTGWPGAGPAVLVSGALVATAGVVVGTARPAPPPPGARGPRLPPAWRAVVTAVVSLVVAVVLATAGTLSVQRLTVHVETATSTPAPTSAPSAGPLVERWRWDAGAPVRSVLAAGPGVVVLRGSELVGLDSRLGRPLWSYERIGPPVVDVVVSPDRRWVAVSHDLDDPVRGGADRLLTVLDAATGAARWTLPTGSAPQQITDRVVTTDDGPGLVARRLDTGETVWTADPPPRCELHITVPTPSVPGIALTVQDCPGPVGGARRLRTLTALDDVSGRPRWSTPPTSIGPLARGVVDLPVLDGGRLVGTPPYGPSLLDTATGAVRGRPAPGQYYAREGDAVRLVDTATNRVLGVVDPVTGRPLPFLPCPELRDGPTTVTGAATLCPAGDGYEVRVNGGPPVPVVLTGAAVAGQPYGYSDEYRSPLEFGGWLVTAPGAIVAGTATPDRTGILVGLGNG